jgi:putative heme-binding domain-containing protein
MKYTLCFLRRFHPAVLALVGAMGGMALPSPVVRAADPAASLTTALRARASAELASTAIQQGDASRGEAIYRRDTLGCVKCHVVSPQARAEGQRSIGPEQTAIGDRLTPEQLVEAVLYPNRSIAKGYAAFVVLTDAGMVHKGVVVSESPESVVLISPETGKATEIPRVDIEEMQPAPSAMPEGLADQLVSEQEFYDLIAFLSEQKAGRTGTPITAAEKIIVKEVPQPGMPHPLLAIARPDGLCYSYDPNACHLVSIWEGPLGWADAAGTVTLNEAAADSFFIREKPWRIEVGRVDFDYEWLGYEVDGDEVVVRYRLTDKEQQRAWVVAETLEVRSPLRQRIRFEITHPEGSAEVLTYWLRQTNYRSVSTNGQQAQRNQLEFLKPGQTLFEIDLVRRKRGQVLPLGYAVEQVEGPEPDRPFLFEPTGFSFAEDGSLFVSTRTGQIWRLRSGVWTRFAEGLHETLGVRVAANGRDVYTMQKPELTLLEDTDGDGRADVYRSVANCFRFTGNYHEFAYGPVRNTAGDLFFSTGLAASGHHEAKESKTGQMSSPLGYRGWVMKVDPQGNLSPFASGLRSPAGIGMNADDELFVTDNQGDWVASSYLAHVEEGDFLGHPAALWDRPEYGLTPRQLDYRSVEATVDNVPSLDEAAYRAERKPPAVWLVHGDLANSPGNPAFDPATGFGPFAGQAFIADISHRAVLRVALEKVNGAYQGAVFPFIRPLASASYSTCFGPDGRLWVGSVGRGWTTGEPIIETVSYDGTSTPFEMQRVALTPHGFDIHFTQPVADDGDGDAVTVQEFHYLYWAEYGSDRQDVRALPVEKPKLSEDRTVLSLRLPVKAGKVYELDLGYVEAASGAILENNVAFYTVNEVLP